MTEVKLRQSVVWSRDPTHVSPLSVRCVTAWLGVGGTGFSLKNWKGSKAEPHSHVGCFLQPVRNGSRRVHGAIQEGPHPCGPPPLPRQGSGLGVTNGSVKDTAAQARLPHHPFSFCEPVALPGPQKWPLCGRPSAAPFFSIFAIYFYLFGCARS